MDMRKQLNQVSNRVLYLNLAVTQAGLALIGGIIYFFFLRQDLPLKELYHFDELGFALLVGAGFAVCVVTLDVVLMKLLPEDYFDDGGVNERLFRDVNVWQIAIIALGVAVVEEFLFRGVLQNLIGLFWSSVIFALLHFRYLKKWLYSVLIIGISLGFGFMYEWTGSLWGMILAHFLIDFILGILIRYRLISFEK
ncbi:CPBP family intramembrane glutamic endopeptidase [Bacillus horti]|uniref:Membrane protease YdiL (CAAX protease family) n=1 Tax=Caldalkalibacillus horti TaxID=77523 RepID=A0ABT9W4K4_9BACI|nr:CPBP family intramembrane glutamic endopeptidase [Bacillus horti]MDQ0168175.1 membrane protease YdiL (CAAX protease family) [Bacillus horti]